mmetsp:Transcript_37967/g.61746  ORF Transcript_37967/g.61746 Transcript_37967/m.61746 type:complete len:270 (-) Transcript_37967:3912-4721(-)
MGNSEEEEDAVSMTSGLLFPVLLTLATWVLQFVAARMLEAQRERVELNKLCNEAELARINWQLKEVYGPLRALLYCMKGSFSEMVRRHTPEDREMTKEEAGLFRENVCAPPPGQGTPEDKPYPGFAGLRPEQSDWVLFMVHVLQPCNRKFLDILVNHSNAFDVPVPGYFVDVMAHIKENEVIIKKWELGDYSHMMTRIAFNDRVNIFVEQEYSRLDNRKLKLLKSLDMAHGVDRGLLDAAETSICMVGDTKNNVSAKKIFPVQSPKSPE